MSSNKFWVNSRAPLVISSVNLIESESLALEYEKIGQERTEIVLPHVVSGKASVEFLFNVNVQYDYYGCYSFSSSSSQLAVTTQFEPNYARRALPCFDEPCFKSTFSLKATVPRKFAVISNMPVASLESVGECDVYTFGETPKMSCYLLHWTLAKLPCIKTTASNGTEITLYCEPIEHSADALQITRESLEFYINYFKIDYPLKKLDLIGLSHFSARAMENWGAVTFKEDILIRDPDDCCTKFKRDARTICHEISHMWFGNLVTMEWWTHLWLNEGFARFMEHKCLDLLRPEFHTWEWFIPDVLRIALDRDASHNTHPIEMDCPDPGMLGTIFDVISYAKGSAVVRMLEDTMGETHFQDGIVEYLNLYAYDNTTTDMLWEVLNRHSELNVCKIMEGWTKREGYPWIHLERASETEFKLSQNNFGVRGGNAPWSIPIRYMTSGGSVGFFLFDRETDVLTLEAPSEWIKLNYKMKGVYLVKYSPEILKSLCENFRDFSMEDRYELIYEYSRFYAKELVAFEELGSILVSCLPQTGEILFSLIHSILSPFMNEWLFYSTCQKFIVFLEKLCFPIWELYGFNISVDNKRVQQLCITAYQTLIEPCKNQVFCSALLQSYEEGSLPPELRSYTQDCLIITQAESQLQLAKGSLPIAVNYIRVSETYEELIESYSNSTDYNPLLADLVFAVPSISTTKLTQIYLKYFASHPTEQYLLNHIKTFILHSSPFSKQNILKLLNSYPETPELAQLKRDLPNSPEQDHAQSFFSSLTNY